MNAVWSYLVFIFLISSLLIALLRPYKKMYVNIFDTILLANITLICHLHAGRYFAGEAWQIMTLTSFPIILFGGLTLYNVGIHLKAKPRLMNIWQHYQKKRTKFSGKLFQNIAEINSESEESSRQKQPLLSSIKIDIKPYGYSQCSNMTFYCDDIIVSCMQLVAIALFLTERLQV